MQQITRLMLISICCLHLSNPVLAGPWLTGPLLAPAGHTVPKGHFNFEMYGLDVFSTGQFNAAGDRVKSPLFNSVVGNPIFSYGLTNKIDLQLSIPYVYNKTRGQHHHQLADISAGVGLQVIEQKESTWRPDLRFAVTETFPTGRYEELNPVLLGTDASGLGGYETQFALNFQLLRTVLDTHYLRTRLSLTRMYYSSVNVFGLSSYGGVVDTEGKINTGIENDADLAFEFTLDKHWVAVMEGYVSKGGGSRFNGILSIGNLGGPTVNVGSGDYTEYALAPAMEYNFNENIGLIGGVWFPVSGKNTPIYTTYVLALNAYW